VLGIDRLRGLVALDRDVVLADECVRPAGLVVALDLEVGVAGGLARRRSVVEHPRGVLAIARLEPALRLVIGGDTALGHRDLGIAERLVERLLRFRVAHGLEQLGAAGDGLGGGLGLELGAIELIGLGDRDHAIVPARRPRRQRVLDRDRAIDQGGVGRLAVFSIASAR